MSCCCNDWGSPLMAVGSWRQAELGVERGKQLCLVWEVGMQGVEQDCEGRGDVEEANSYDSGVVR
jgi:hypothetical protein